MRRGWWIVGVLVGIVACKSAAAIKHDGRPLALAPPEDSDASPRLVGAMRASPAAPGWCAHLLSANARTIARHSIDAGCVSPELECVEDDAGAAWGWSIRSARETGDYGGCTEILQADIVRSDGDARISGDAGLELSLSSADGMTLQNESGQVRLLGDYDGDGEQEVLFTRNGWEHEGGGSTESRVWTLRNGTPMHYAPADAFVIVAAEDVDRDGKVDLVVRGSYTKAQAQSGVGFWYPIGPAIFLEHALPDGSFTMTDSIAIAFTQSKCVAPTEQTAKIVCDRLHGKSEGEVLGALKKNGCVDFLEDPTRYPESCPKFIPGLAAINPPFRF